MRKSEVEDLNERVTQRYREQYMKGILRAPKDGFVSLDGWENQPETLKARICRMLEWSKKIAPLLIDTDRTWLLEADEFQIVSEEARKDMTEEEVMLMVIEAAKTEPYLDCVRGWSMRLWLNRGRWDKIVARKQKEDRR